MSGLGRIAAVLPRIIGVGYTVLPTVVDASIALAVRGYVINSFEMANWVLGGSTLAGLATAVILRRNTAVYKIPGTLIYLAWKTYEAYLYHSAVKSDLEKQERRNLERAETQKQNEINNFFNVIRTGKYSTEDFCKYLKKSPHFFDQKDTAGKNALHLAAENGRAAFITWLSSTEAEIFSKLDVAANGWKPLHLAIKCGKVECAQILSKKDPKKLLDEEVPTVGNARSIALKEDKVEIILWLEGAKLLLQETETIDQFFEKVLEAKASTTNVIDWFYKKNKQQSVLDKALKFALEKGHVPVATWVQQQNQTLNQEILANFASLSETVKAGHQNMLQWVHTRLRTAIQTKDPEGKNLMDIAIAHNQLAIARWLHSQDSNLLKEAAQRDFTQVFQQEKYRDMAEWVQATTKQILRDETQKKENRERAITNFFACIERFKSEEDAVTVNSYWNSDPTLFDCLNKNGENVLHIAARKGHIKLIELIRLVGLFSKLNVATQNGWKPLQLAAKHGNLPVVEALSKQDPQVLKEEVPEVGNVRLIAIIEGQANIVTWLDENRQLLQENETYDQLFEQALNMKINSTSAIDWLHKEKVEKKEPALEKALTTSVEKGTLSLAKWVFEKNAEALKKVRPNGKNLMYVAIEKGQKEIAVWLDLNDKSLFEELRGQDLSGIVDREKNPTMATWVSQRALS